MSLHAGIDKKKLDKSMREFAKKFGDTNAQAVIRWSVQVCRGLAMQTQAYGRTGTRKTQINAIQRDMINIMFPVKSVKIARNGTIIAQSLTDQKLTISPERYLPTAQEVNSWINSNRRNGRTKELGTELKKCCLLKDWKAVLKERSLRAGMAKGGWVGAGQSIAAAQTGAEKVNIGKNYLAYTHKFAHLGRSQKPTGGYNPKSTLTNTVKHTASKSVLAKGAIATAISEGLRATIKWYKFALRKTQ